MLRSSLPLMVASLLAVTGCGRLLYETIHDAGEGGVDAHDRVIDSTVDVPADVPVDSPIDVPVDSPIDVSDDSPMDTATEAPLDTSREPPIDVPSDADAGSGTLAIAVGGAHSCLLRDDATMACWGLNFYGQLGDGTATMRLTPTDVTAVSGTQSVAVGDGYTCVVDASRSVLCWGTNQHATLGTGTEDFSEHRSPLNVVGAAGAVELAAGSTFACARLTDGSVLCWGETDFGQLGNGVVAPGASGPVVVDRTVVLSASAIAAGSSHGCAVLATSGRVYCWGQNSSGQLGDGTTMTSALPVRVGSLTNAVHVTTGNVHSCALLGSGSVWCWGASPNGQLGNGTRIGSVTPGPVSGLTDAASISGRGGVTCALRRSGELVCWGDNLHGGVGDGTMADALSPTNVVGGAATPSAASGGSSHSCAVNSAPLSVWCWGANTFGQLGDGTTAGSPTPVRAL